MTIVNTGRRMLISASVTCRRAPCLDSERQHLLAGAQLLQARSDDDFARLEPRRESARGSRAACRLTTARRSRLAVLDDEHDLRC